MPILGVIASQISGRLGPTYTNWISNVLYSGSANINIVAQGWAGASSSTAYLASGGAGSGISGGNYPSWWVQNQSGTYTNKYSLLSFGTWGSSGVLVDNSGNVYLSLNNPGTGDAVVAKVSAAGSVVWAKNINSYYYVNAVALTPDQTKLLCSAGTYEDDKPFLMNTSDGSIAWANNMTAMSVQNGYTGGLSNTYAYFAGYERSGSNQGFIRQMNVSNGTTNWAKWYNDGTSVTTACFVDSSSNVYVGGYLTSGSYFIKINSSGTLQWQKYFGSGQQFPKWGGVDSLGNVYVQHNSGTVSYLIKLNSSGVVQWQRSITGAAGTSNSGTVAVLNDSNIFVTFSASDGSYVNAYQMVVPTDGSKTGTYTVGGKTLTYAASSISIGDRGGSLATTNNYSSRTQNVTNAGLGTISALGNSTGLTSI